MFLRILSLTVLAFGVINQVMLEPRAPFDVELLNKVLYRPYFQMYGELFLEDYEHAAGKLRNKKYNTSFANQVDKWNTVTIWEPILEKTRAGIAEKWRLGLIFDKVEEY